MGEGKTSFSPYFLTLAYFLGVRELATLGLTTKQPQ
jgi:hypothetical protein